ncbi:GATA-binding factor 3 X2, partial [Biomphalaria glabrata]
STIQWAQEAAVRYSTPTQAQHSNKRFRNKRFYCCYCDSGLNVRVAYLASTCKIGRPSALTSSSIAATQ